MGEESSDKKRRRIITQIQNEGDILSGEEGHPMCNDKKKNNSYEYKVLNNKYEKIYDDNNNIINDKNVMYGNDEYDNIDNNHNIDDLKRNNNNNNNNNKKNIKHYLIENLQNKSLLLNNFSSVEENKLYVKNINEHITKEDFENYFSNVDGYIETRFVVDASRTCRKFAYIDFENKTKVLSFLDTLQDSNIENFKTLKLNNVDLLVSISKPKKSLYEEKIVFIKFTKCNIDCDIDIKEKISDFLLKHTIDVLDIRLLGDTTNKHGYIELQNNEDVIKCVDNIKLGKIDELEFNLNYSIPIIKKKIIPDIEKIKMNKEKTKQLKEEKKKEKECCTIVVKNLHFNTRKNKLQNIFGQIGEIENIYLSKKISENNIKRNKGYAFITFKNPNDATSSLILNDIIIDGRNILISKFTNDKDGIYLHNQDLYNHNKTKNDYHYKKDKKQYFEKKRINLNKTNDNPTQNEKKNDNQTIGMTNDDFRKLFFKS
ncbi:U4/U6 snRNA-associated-splicing factor, putative [Plasmodium sp. gorilla clade G2]|uniref:U4/U6 snRNA-associated-splicing factor, putative n=1 Tax=Plasmodium sp. gorilla clade G2 TaxID=880535 RepID=UPI000D2168F6|nr:U4/U6 snRNA-associated-splicing factor, putative [Plasmodium sp. gorilla clade G2]SOV14299.1 U4/U6 snRNA-associated-splicing factor, putative [Plasmodium sp. gorilla clade G2]